VANGVAYFGSYDGSVHALEAATGHQLWSSPVSGEFTTPAVADGVVYAGSADHALYAFALSPGSRP